MASLRRKVTRRTQPQTAPKLKSQYAAWGWVYTPSAGVRNLGSKRIDGVFTGSAGYDGASKAGKAYTLGATSTSALRLGDTSCKFTQTKPVSGLIVFKTLTTTGNEQALFIASSSGSGLYVKRNGSGNIEIDCAMAVLMLAGTGGEVKAGNINVVAFCIEPRVVDGGTGRVAYALNGKLVTGTWTATPSFTSLSAFGIQVGEAATHQQMLSCATTASISNNELVTLSLNPWQIFESTPLIISTGASVGTITRPNSDIAVSGWTSSDAQPLYSDIDEATASDVDYIISPALSNTASGATFGLTTSLTAGIYDINIRARKTETTGQIRVVLKDSGGTSVGATNWQVLTGSYVSYVLRITITGTATQSTIEAKL
jgi:hypothetical protein